MWQCFCLQRSLSRVLVYVSGSAITSSKHTILHRKATISKVAEWDLTSMFMLNRSQQIACISHDHHIHECVAGVGGEWQQANLTILTGAPRTTRRFLVGYAWPEGGTRQVPYPGPEGHLHEPNVTVGGGWQRVDLTILAGAPPVTQ